MVNTMHESHTIEAAAAVKIFGRFDAFSAHQVKTQLDARLSAGQRTIIVDMSQVRFVDSTALSLLVRTMKRTRSRGGDLLIYGLQEPVRIIFELTRMDKTFTIVDAYDELQVL